MLGKQLEHVIEKRQPGTNPGLATTIEVKLHPHIGLFGFTLDLRDPRRGLHQTALRFVHCLHLVDRVGRAVRLSLRIVLSPSPSGRGPGRGSTVLSSATPLVPPPSPEKE